MKDSDNILDEKKPIVMRLSLIILAAGVVWWGARTDTKLSSIETTLNTIATVNGRHGDRLDDLERRLGKIEVVGSANVQQLQKDVSELLRQFELHRAKETKP